MQLTNVQDALKFTAFLEEGLRYVDAWTPTIINNGGCGIFAQILGDKLAEAGMQYEIIGLFPKDVKGQVAKIEADFRLFLQTNRVKNYEVPQHIVVKIGELYIDSEGIVNAEVINNKDLFVMSREQLNILVMEARWNPMFDRGCIPIIQSKMDEVFSSFENFHSGAFEFPVDDVRLSEHTIKIAHQQMF